jgi:glycine/D-amino acid oxidase-like deaminating enzyme
MGLTAANMLVEAGFRVTVYSDKFTPQTTSDVAGGQWAPSLVAFDEASAAAKNDYFDLLRVAKQEHEKRIGQGFGVSRKWNYSTQRISHLDILPHDIVPAATPLAHLPFAKLTKRGWKYDILLVEPPTLMAKLQSLLVATQVSFVKRKFSNRNDVLTLKENFIVNCTGLGSRQLFSDQDLVPVKGQLVFLKPQPNLGYLFSGDGYVFPRADAVVVGGSQQSGVDDATPDPAMCKTIVDHAKAVFEGKRVRAALSPDWLIRNK